jgi:hypothetical protein
MSIKKPFYWLAAQQNGLLMNVILRITSITAPCAAIIQIRFKGYALSLLMQAPLKRMIILEYCLKELVVSPNQIAMKRSFELMHCSVAFNIIFVG